MIKFNLSEINIGKGKIEFNDFELNLSEPLSNQLDNLKEDLLQIIYPKGLLLDVGWYSSFDKDGVFQVRVIEKFNWDKPLYYSEVKSIGDLKTAIKNAVSIASGTTPNLD